MRGKWGMVPCLAIFHGFYYKVQYGRPTFCSIKRYYMYYWYYSLLLCSAVLPSRTTFFRRLRFSGAILALTVTNKNQGVEIEPLGSFLSSTWHSAAHKLTRCNRTWAYVIVHGPKSEWAPGLFLGLFDCSWAEQSSPPEKWFSGPPTIFQNWVCLSPNHKINHKELMRMKGFAQSPEHIICSVRSLTSFIFAACLQLPSITVAVNNLPCPLPSPRTKLSPFAIGKVISIYHDILTAHNYTR